MAVDIEKLTSWSEGKRVETKRGPRLLREGPATKEFYAAWKSNQKAELKSAGVSMKPPPEGSDELWTALWWMPISGESEQSTPQTTHRSTTQWSAASDSAQRFVSNCCGQAIASGTITDPEDIAQWALAAKQAYDHAFASKPASPPPTARHDENEAPPISDEDYPPY